MLKKIIIVIQRLNEDQQILRSDLNIASDLVSLQVAFEEFCCSALLQSCLYASHQKNYINCLPEFIQSPSAGSHQ